MTKHYEIGPRMSQAVVHNGIVHIAGQVAITPSASIKVQTSEVLSKIDGLLAQAGTNKSNLLAVNIFLPNIIDFDAMNSIYDKWIDPANPPARACVEARLANSDLRVEMTAIAKL